MLRVPRAGSIALPLSLILALVAASLVTADTRRATSRGGVAAETTMAAPAWPTSTLLISEVQTGGTSASDEFAELTNAGSLAVDLTGLEVVYATATGSTVTRKASWASATILEPGRHLLIGNAAGVHAAQADVTYSGGFAATGGAIVLRVVGGAPVDAVGWGDATSAFVEGAAAPAPGAGQSLERLPGGAAGNGLDSNDNLADFRVGTPSPQNVASEPTPDPSASPTPTPSATPIPSATPVPTTQPTPTPTPTATPTASASVPPSPEPTPPAPTATPVPSANATPVPVTAIADARSLPDGTTVRVAGTTTTALGAIDAGRIGFVQDATAGIAIRLDVALVPSLPAGTAVTFDGTVGSYFSLRVLNVAAMSVAAAGPEALPDAVGSATGAASEALEGVRLTLRGEVVEAPATLSDGLGVTIDDGTGPIRVILGPDGLAARSVQTGDTVTASGPLGQRDSSGTGLAGYRLHATLPGEVAIDPAPVPTPTPSPSSTSTPTPSGDPSPAPAASPSGSASPSGTPSPTSSPSPSASMTIRAARGTSIGGHVAVVGVVTAEAGRLGLPALIAIQDDTAGIAIRLPDGFAPPVRGSVIDVTGTLADPYGQLEIRTVSAIRVTGSGPIPAPLLISGSALDDDVEGSLVSLEGVVDGRPTKATSGDVTFIVDAAGRSIRLFADASTGIAPATITDGQRLRVTGVAGQRASRKGAADGFRIWLRGPADIVRLGSASTATPRPTGATSTSSGSAGVISVAAAILARSGVVTVEGIVTIQSRLLDATGRRILVQDRTAAIEILLPVGAAAPAVGTRIRVTGETGRAYGAPRIRASAITRLGSGSVAPIDLRAAPGPAHEWRLVTMRGDLSDVHRSGERWTAELRVAGVRIPVAGLAGASIPYSAILEGHSATITGIVRRPHPSATDRRFAVQPRSSRDVRIGGPAQDASASGLGGSPSGSGGSSSALGGNGGLANPGIAIDDVDLVRLSSQLGRTVRVGGLVAAVRDDGFDLDDGTALGGVLLRGPARDVAGSLAVGDALSAVGRVEALAEGAGVAVVVDDPGAVVLVGGLGTGAGAEDEAGGLAPAGSGIPAADRADSVSAGLGEPVAPPLGILGIVLISVASLGVTVLRRHRVQRRFEARIAQRLSAISRPEPTSCVATGAIDPPAPGR
jgi:hypothetical protein